MGNHGILDGVFAHAITACRRSASRSRCAFTLVELLVVIGIIAVLMGLLMPALSRARESSKRTACLSNLRQVYTLLQLYAQDNRDVVPIGYRVGRKQWDSMVYSATSGKYCLFGTLYVNRGMIDPQVYYCPSELDPQSAFNTDINPWPPGPDGNPAKQTYAGYCLRPDYELPDALQTVPGITVPRLAEFRNKAVLADLIHTPTRVDTRHRTGVNVLYGHGGAYWVDRSEFDDDLKQCPSISPAANPFQDHIWSTFDDN